MTSNSNFEIASLQHQRTCVRCVMDTSDPQIAFDQDGVCNHCRNFFNVTSKNWFPNEQGSQRLKSILDRIKTNGKGKQYDCTLGLSGGADSCYLAIKAYEWGLRPLVIHVDTGWNSDMSVSNVERIVNHCGFELHTEVIDWEEMKDLQLAYLRSGVSNQDVPQDHAIFASIYKYSIHNGIRCILSGGNTASESIFPGAWHGNAMDAINLRAIHRQFGERPLRRFPLISFWKLYLLYPLILRMRPIRLLNYIPYSRNIAIKEMNALCGWKPYGHKHGESQFTRLFQNDFLPRKFGYDKRRPHFSSLIMSGQMTREEALKSLAEPLYAPQELMEDISYLCNKLDITQTEFHQFLSLTNRHYSEFPNWDRRYSRLKKIQALFERITSKRIRAYS